MVSAILGLIQKLCFTFNFVVEMALGASGFGIHGSENIRESEVEELKSVVSNSV